MSRTFCVSMFVLVLIAVCLLSSAQASDSEWSLYLRNSSTNYTSSGPAVTVGTKSASSDGKDDNDVVWPTHMESTSNTRAEICAYQPDWVGSQHTYQTDIRASITPGETRQWDLRLWCMPGYIFGNMRLSWFASTNADVPDTIGGIDYIYQIDIYDDPTGEHTNFHWESTDLQGGEFTNPIDHVDWSHALIMDATRAQTEGIKIRITATPVPEPSSMLALMAGVCGLSGAALRKKK